MAPGVDPVVYNAYAGLNSLGTSGIFMLVPSLAEAESMRAWWTEHRCAKRGEGYRILVIFPTKLEGASVWALNCLGCGGHCVGQWDEDALAAETAKQAMEAETVAGSAPPT